MLLDCIVDASLRSLTLSSLLGLLFAFLLSLARRFSIGGRETCAGTRSLSLARW